MLSTGRIAGISGIFSGLLNLRGEDKGWRIAFVAGLILAPILAGLIGYGMAQPKLPTNWAVIIAAGVLVGFGTRLGGGCTSDRGAQPWFAGQYFRPSKSGIDLPLVSGAALFGIGWGLVGLCPGPALESLATLSPGIIVFVVAMAAGMIAHDAWQQARLTAQRDRGLASRTGG